MAGKRLKIAAAYRSDVGRKRDHNEDAAGIWEPGDAREAEASGWLYVVADGMGGHRFGERASQKVVQALLEGYPAAPQEPPPRRLERLIRLANEQIHAEGQRTLAADEHMGTTVVAAVIHQGKLYLAHVGDSRAYIIRGERIRQLTRDHSVVNELVDSGVLTPAEARTSRLRNRLTRSVGIRPDVDVELSGPFALQQGDLLLLCSDGLTQYATDRDLLAAAYGQPEEIVARLIDFANDRGGSDNITVMAVRYGDVPLIPVQRQHQIVRAGALLALAVIAVFAMRTGWEVYKAARTLPPTASVVSPASPTPNSIATATFSPMPSETPTATFSPAPVVNETLPAATGTPDAAGQLVHVDCIYTVTEGDSAWQIAVDFGVQMEDLELLADDAPLRSLQQIYPGDRLKVPRVLPGLCESLGGEVQSPTLEATATQTATPTGTMPAATDETDTSTATALP